MMRKCNFALCVAATMALAATGCKMNSSPYQYQLTVEVETPEGIQSGSTVIAVLMTSSIKGAEALGGSGPTARGEAVAVDLPNGKTLFVLLRSDTDVDWAGSAHIKSTGFKQDDFADKAQFRETLRNNRIVYPVQRWVETRGGEKIDNYPMMVMFDDIKDPRTVKRVDPQYLAVSFGDGYMLKTISVVGTDEPVTRGIEKRLGWLPGVYQLGLGADFKPVGVPVGDFQRLFSTELSK